MTARGPAYLAAEKRESNAFGWGPGTPEFEPAGAAVAVVVDEPSETEGFNAGLAVANLVAGLVATFGFAATGDGDGGGDAVAVVSAAALPRPTLRARLE